MKNNLLFFLTATILVSCSTYNYQSNNADIAIYELKTEPKEALFTENKFTKGSHTLKFFIHDLDDSTFQFKNVQIYDSTLSGELLPVESKIVNDILKRKNIQQKDEVHIEINRQCTNKNTQIYLKPIDVVKLQNYEVTEELRERNKQQIKKIIKIYLLVNLISALAIFIAGLIIFG